MATVGDILAAVDRLAPWALAEEWDNVGLLVGDPAAAVSRLLVALDATDAVCQEAERLGAEAVLAHHPLIMEGVQRLTAETPRGRTVLGLAAGGRALIAAHTNLDSAEGGLSDLLAGGMGLTDLEPLRPPPARKAYKVVVFVPEAALEAVRAAAFEAGAGRIGEYAECGFAAEGTGTFRPGPGAEPSVGEKGRRNQVREMRFETLADARRLGPVLAAVAQAHPYEEPAIDVYPLHGRAGTGGLGRAGRLSDSRTLAALADKVKESLGSSAVEFSGDPDGAVERVAVCTGSGSGLTDAVAAARCQAYVTGELKHHEVLDLAARGIGVILGGHYATERVPLEAWAPRLAGAVDCQVLVSRAEADPMRRR